MHLLNCFVICIFIIAVHSCLPFSSLRNLKKGKLAINHFQNMWVSKFWLWVRLFDPGIHRDFYNHVYSWPKFIDVKMHSKGLFSFHGQTGVSTELYNPVPSRSPFTAVPQRIAGTNSWPSVPMNFTAMGTLQCRAFKLLSEGQVLSFWWNAHCCMEESGGKRWIKVHFFLRIDYVDKKGK